MRHIRDAKLVVGTEATFETSLEEAIRAIQWGDDHAPRKAKVGPVSTSITPLTGVINYAVIITVEE